MSAKLYRTELRKRMKAAREAKSLTQEQVGAWLGIGRAGYQKHEERGSLPPYLFEHFSVICDLDPIYLLTGRSEATKRRAS